MNSLDQHGPTQTTLNLTTNLKVDGRTIASIVEKYIVNGGRVVNASSGHDGQETPSIQITDSTTNRRRAGQTTARIVLLIAVVRGEG